MQPGSLWQYGASQPRHERDYTDAAGLRKIPINLQRVGNLRGCPF
jgi:hypothetical protein